MSAPLHKRAFIKAIKAPPSPPAAPAPEAVSAPAAVKEEPAPAPKAENNGSVLVLTKRVVTERDIKAAAAQHYTKIQLPEKPVITYLAKDTAFELGIELL